MHRSFKVHFRLVVLGWLRKSEGCNIGLLRLREVLSRESNTSEDLIFFCAYIAVVGLPLATLPRHHLGKAHFKHFTVLCTTNNSQTSPLPNKFVLELSANHFALRVRKVFYSLCSRFAFGRGNRKVATLGC